MNILKRNQTLIAAFALAAVFAVLGSTNVNAQSKKPGGGGGGGGGSDPAPVPPGTVYFLQARDSDSSCWSMKGDGSGKAEAICGEPSYQLHNGKRWFLSVLPTGEEDPNASYGLREELFVIDEDGGQTQLTFDSDLLLESWLGRPVRWVNKDASLSFVAVTTDPESGEWLGEALFRANVTWNEAGPVMNTPQKVLDSNYYYGDETGIDIGWYDWSPLGDAIVYNDGYDNGYSAVKISYFGDGGSTEPFLLGEGWYPEWSPDGNWIVFGSGADYAIWKIRPNGTDALKLSSPGSNQLHSEPIWSIDSQHVAFTETTRINQKGNKPPLYTYDIIRISATGGTPTNLTGDTDARCYPMSWR